MVLTQPILTYEAGLEPLGQHIIIQHNSTPDRTVRNGTYNNHLHVCLHTLWPLWLRADITWSVADLPVCFQA